MKAKKLLLLISLAAPMFISPANAAIQPDGSFRTFNEAASSDASASLLLANNDVNSGDLFFHERVITGDPDDFFSVPVVIGDTQDESAIPESGAYGVYAGALALMALGARLLRIRTAPTDVSKSAKAVLNLAVG